jgi:hypothetical protein
MIFTPLSKNGKRRLTLHVKPFQIPRGQLGAKFAVELLSGKIKRARVVACSIAGCACDAQVI